jgi:hypothetical protein
MMLNAKRYANLSQVAQKKEINLHPCRKLVQTKYHKGASTKMHKCLVGNKTYLKT